VSNAIREMVVNKSVNKLGSLGRRFIQQSNERLAQMITSKGVAARVSDGKVYVSAKDLGREIRGDFGHWITLRQAVDEGLIGL
jgi:hypothetical protein